MSKASTERDQAVETMQMAIDKHLFTELQVEAMLMVAVKRMTVAEIEQLILENTGYMDLMDVDVDLD